MRAFCYRHFGLWALVVSLLPSFACAANLVVDGGFEVPVAGPGGFNSGYLNFNSGQTIASAWTVIGSGADVSVFPNTESTAGGTFTVQEGLQALDLTGDFDNGAAMGVQQTLATTPGAQYTLSFYVGHFDGAARGGPSATVLVMLNGALYQTAVNSGNTAGADNWLLFTDTFVATSATTTLAFINGTASTSNGGGIFAGLDNVQFLSPAAAVPEPAPCFLLAIALLPLIAIRRRSSAHSYTRTSFQTLGVI